MGRLLREDGSTWGHHELAPSLGCRTSSVSLYRPGLISCSFKRLGQSMGITISWSLSAELLVCVWLRGVSVT